MGWIELDPLWCRMCMAYFYNYFSHVTTHSQMYQELLISMGKGADAIHMPAAAIIVERTHDSLPPQSRPGVSQHAKNVAPHGHAHSGSKSSIFTMKN